ALHAHAQAERGDPLLAAVPRRLHLALDAAVAEATGDHDAVQAGQRLGVAAVLQLLAVDPADLHVAPRRPARVADRLGDGQIGVAELDVLADEPDLERDARGPDALHERAPLREVRLGRALRQPELVDDDLADAGFLEHERDRVDGPRVRLG